MSLVQTQAPDATATRQFLLDQFRQIQNVSSNAMRSRAGRVAITFRMRSKSGRDAVADAPIPLEDVLVYMLSYEPRNPGSKGGRWYPILQIFDLQPDPHGAGGVILRCQAYENLMRVQRLVEPQFQRTMIRTAILLHQALQDTHRSLVQEVPRWPVIEPQVVEGTTSKGETHVRLDQLKGRMVRNPAFAVLQQHGIVSPRMSYGAWLNTVSTWDGTQRVVADPQEDATETARIRRVILDYVLADSEREVRLFAAMAAAANSLGIATGQDNRTIDQLAELIDNPWKPQSIHFAASIQVVRREGLALQLSGTRLQLGFR